MLLCCIMLCFQDRGVALFSDTSACATGSIKYRALLVGISEYRSFKDLKTPVNDVLDLQGLLQTKYGFEAVEVLTNAQATRSNIVKALNCLSANSDPGDSVLVYFAGHGVRGRGQSGYWVPYDGDHGDPATFVSNSEILGYCENSHAKHMLIVSDACFSGMIFKGAGESYSPDKDYIRNTFSLKSRWVISSGFDTTVADVGPSEKHSPFAHSLINFLNEANQAYITAQYLSHRIRLKTGRSERGQLCKLGSLPEFGHEGGSFVFWNKSADPNGEPFPPPWEAKPLDYLPQHLRGLRGRRVLVENGGDDMLKNFLEDLEMDVVWDVDTRRRNRRTIISYCSEVPAQAITALVDFLNLGLYTLKTHHDDPEQARDEDCGKEYEITIRN